jgi:SAM-dependent methyltransferase
VKFTGERYTPGLDWPDVSCEHWHRYLWAAGQVAGLRVLDLACGEGYGSALLARTAARVTGIDSSADAIAHAARTYRAANLRFVQGRAGHVPIAEESCVDVIVSFETIEHLDAEEQRRLIAEARRLLQPSGVLLISTPEPAHYNVGREPNVHHVHELGRAEFEALLRGAFRHVSFLGQRVYPASYLWPLDATPQVTREHQLRSDEQGYRPVEDDAKCPMYVVARCSDAPGAPAEASLLLDVTPRPGTNARDALASVSPKDRSWLRRAWARLIW